ncbi:tRNA (uridine(54)-C5)-methyltransferase TrmA [Maricurvus nonylphenolicus]|uniref:tRNA (uridine(54)-C5)-methyltransferase TrmA n=1 Tax=Maricurvus nonylphenolicus TaxID=1008307 RepID=UPI0036F41D15
MAIHQVFPEQYQQQLDDKIQQLSADFTGFVAPEVEVFTSAPRHYRMRAEFKMWQEKGQAHYAMYQPGEYKKPFIIDNFEVGSEIINQLMPKLLTAINKNDLLRERLFQTEFLTTLSGEAVITLIYHKALTDEWEAEANTLREHLGVSIIGRSRKQKRVLGDDFVIEKLSVNDRIFSYQQVETGFTQPNAEVCEKMLAWALDASTELKGDLLELYCGNGNFTVPLATHFNRVLATEISKTSVKSAQFNLQQNQIDNVEIVRMSSEEFSQAMDKQRSFRRLADINLDSYEFSTVFVDPPRAGLDDHTVDIVKGFDNILYVSCNPETLRHNLKSICETHDIKRFAAFDQFPYTPHLECGVLLQRKR